MAEQTGFSSRRERLWNLIFDEYRSQYINYRRYYLASDELGRRGKRVNYITTVASGVLLAIIGAAATLSRPEWFNVLALSLSALTAALSITSTFGQWQLKSNQYYNSGQQHQELFKEFEYFVEVRIADKAEEIDDLEQRAQDLIRKKNDLNEATPQLHTKWFKKLKEQRNIDWDRPTLAEIEAGEYDFH